MKIQDYSSKGLPLNQRDFNDEMRRAWNNALLEIKKVTTSSPNWTESVDGIMVLSQYGASWRLYISDTAATNKWVYCALTEL